MAAMKSVTAAKNRIKTSRVDKIYYTLMNIFLFLFFSLFNLCNYIVITLCCSSSFSLCSLLLFQIREDFEAAN